MPPREQSSLLTLRKGLEVLESIANGPGDLSLTELSNQLQKPVTVIYRILRTLADLGYVQKDPRTKRYSLGLRVWEIGERALARLGLVDVVRPVLSRLTQATGETSSIAVPRDTHFLYIATVEGRQPLRAYIEPGTRFSLALPTASGRSILALSAPDLVDRVLADGLTRFTPATVTDPDKLREILAEIRRVGVAVVHGEYRAHLSSVAAPIRNAVGECVAAVAVSGLSQSLERENLTRIVELVRDASEEIWRKLGPNHATVGSDASAGGERGAAIRSARKGTS